MFTLPLFSWFSRRSRDRVPLCRPNLSVLAGQDHARFPRFVRESAVAMKYLHLLGPLDWDSFPQQSGHPFAPGSTSLPLSTFVATYLVNSISSGLSCQLCQYPLEPPA